jgi:hypothetical protein
LQVLAQEVSPVARTIWRESPVIQPRRCSRLARDRFVSIVDKAIARKKDLKEGPSMASRRLGELNADDLLAVAVEDKRALLIHDVEALAVACDIPCGALLAPAAPSPVCGSSP